MNNHAILANLIRDRAISDPNLDVLTFVNIDSNNNFVEEVRTYKQLWDNGQKIAAHLEGIGLKEGDSFGIVMANHPEFVDLMVASSILGSIFVPIDYRTSADRLKFMLEFAECKGAFVADYALENVSQALNGSDAWIIPFSNKDHCMHSILNEVQPEPPIEVRSTDPEAPMQMLYTSGTTGDPKAILSAHSRFLVGNTVGDIIGITGNDRPYTGLSLTHANAQLVTLGCTLHKGLRGVISRTFTKSRLWDLTRHYGCTWFNLLGGMTTAIYSEPRKSSDADNPVRIVLSAGIPLAIWDDFAQRFDVSITEFYGAAEGGLALNVAGAGPAGSCGKAPPHLQMKILDEEDNECASGEAGEVCFRNTDGSPLVVNYFKQPHASKDKTRDGWLRMGDIGHVDHDGWLFFHHRKGSGIRRNGDFIDTAIIEKLLSEMDVVDDVFIYGIPAANGVPGEKDVVAAIVQVEDVDLNVRKIFSECTAKLSGNLVPAYLHVVDEIPKTASEKPQERFLLEMLDLQGPNVYSLEGHLL